MSDAESRSQVWNYYNNIQMFCNNFKGGGCKV